LLILDSTMTEATITTQTRLCYDEFGAFTRGCREHMKNNTQGALDRSVSSSDLLEWISRQKTKLELFADVLGVSAESKLSVEHRLRANPAARNAVSQLLKTILKNTKFCTNFTHERREMQLKGQTRETQSKPWTDTGIPDDQASASASEELYGLALQRVGRDIANLLDFAAFIRTRSMQQYKERSRSYNPQDSDGVDLVQYFKNVLDRALEQQNPDLKIMRDNILEQRIKKIILDRWLRLCYCIHRHEQLQGPGTAVREDDGGFKQLDKTSIDESDLSKAERSAVHIFNNGENLAAPTQKATTFSGSLVLRVKEHQAQSSAPSVTLTTTGDLNARIPRLKRSKTEYDSGLLNFLCPLCRLPQQMKSGARAHEQHRVWKYGAW
jgi:hypothetical protein